MRYVQFEKRPQKCVEMGSVHFWCIFLGTKKPTRLKNNFLQTIQSGERGIGSLRSPIPVLLNTQSGLLRSSGLPLFITIRRVARKYICRHSPNYNKKGCDFHHNLRNNPLFGGERGIRTPGASQLNGFQDRRNRPLCHLSNDKSTLFFLICKIFLQIF